MATIYNSDLTKELVEAGKLQVSRDRIPMEFADKVVPVVDVNPKHLRRCNIVKSVGSTASAGTTTIYGVPTDKDFFLCAVQLSLSKGATCDVANGRYAVICTIDGATSQVVQAIAYQTLTAENGSITVSFPNPIKIDRGTNIQVNSFTYTAGVSSRTASIVGYLIDNINA